MESRRAGRRTLSTLAVPVAVALVCLALWDTFLVYPLRIFVVFLHEISHGLAAVATGGSIVRIEVSFDEGGLCLTQGGSRFLTLSAGYLGSLLWGAALLVLAARTRADRALLGTVGLFVLAVTLLFVRSAFGFAYGMAAGATFLAVAWKLGAGVSEFLLTVIGVVSCLYAVWDVGSDVLFRSVPGSDADALGQITGIPGVAWGVLWVVIDVVVLALALRSAAKGEG